VGGEVGGVVAKSEEEGEVACCSGAGVCGSAGTVGAGGGVVAKSEEAGGGCGDCGGSGFCGSAAAEGEEAGEVPAGDSEVGIVGLSKVHSTVFLGAPAFSILSL
jgi:hypothetical protein